MKGKVQRTMVSIRSLLEDFQLDNINKKTKEFVQQLAAHEKEQFNQWKADIEMQMKNPQEPLAL